MTVTTISKKKLKLRVVCTANFSEHFGFLQIAAFQSLFMQLLRKKPVDRYVFEHINNNLVVRCSGYGLFNHILDEKTVLYKNHWPEFKKFWIKLDKYPEYWAVTFLFPEDY